MWPQKDNDKLWRALLDLRDRKIQHIDFAKLIPHKTVRQCEIRLQTLRGIESGAATCGQKKHLSKKRLSETWTLDEERLLRDIISRQERDWTEINRFVGGSKTAALCRNHWHSMLASEDFEAPRASNGMIKKSTR